MNRVKDLPDMYDSDEENAWGPGGLLPSRSEIDDFGEEALSYKKAIDRAVRRLDRRENSMSFGRIAKQHQKERKPLGDTDKNGIPKKRPKDLGSRVMGIGESRVGGQHEEALDDLDLALLGEGQDEDDAIDYESGMDDTEEMEMTDDEIMNES